VILTLNATDFPHLFASPSSTPVALGVARLHARTTYLQHSAEAAGGSERRAELALQGRARAHHHRFRWFVASHLPGMPQQQSRDGRRVHPHLHVLRDAASAHGWEALSVAHRAQLIER
jgi:hypothetical protein